jgi:hypothetical protein
MLNESGRLVRAQSRLKASKKEESAEVMLLVSNDHSGKLVNAHSLLNEGKK